MPLKVWLSEYGTDVPIYAWAMTDPTSNVLVSCTLSWFCSWVLSKVHEMTNYKLSDSVLMQATTSAPYENIVHIYISIIYGG